MIWFLNFQIAKVEANHSTILSAIYLSHLKHISIPLEAYLSIILFVILYHLKHITIYKLLRQIHFNFNNHIHTWVQKCKSNCRTNENYSQSKINGTQTPERVTSTQHKTSTVRERELVINTGKYP